MFISSRKQGAKIGVHSPPMIVPGRNPMRKLKSGLMTLAIVLAITLLGAPTASALSLDGVLPSGVPNFTHGVRVQANFKRNDIRAFSRNKAFTLEDVNGNYYVGTGGDYLLQASYDDNLNVTSGGVWIYGRLPELGITSKKTLLFSADIVSGNLVDSATLWGFNTTNLWCAPEIDATAPGGCTNAESIYLAFDSMFDGNLDGVFNTRGFAVTTIPVPPAVWLFGSALGLLGWVRRRKTS